MTFWSLVVGGVLLAAIGYATWVYIAWTHFGHPSRPSLRAADLMLDHFMPNYDVVERHHVTVAAPADVVFATACQMDLNRHPVVRVLVAVRQFVLGARQASTTSPTGLLDYARSIGWGDLAAVAGREVVLGAVTRPWEPNVVFQPLSRDAFRAFNEPGYVKIAWTLRADTRHDGYCDFWTETRAVATDDVSRRQFRWYWARFSAGIALIRRAMLGPLKRLAERTNQLQPAA